MSEPRRILDDPRRATRALLGLLVIGSTCAIAILLSLGIAADTSKDALAIMSPLAALVLGFFFKQDADESRETS